MFKQMHPLTFIEVLKYGDLSAQPDVCPWADGIYFHTQWVQRLKKINLCFIILLMIGLIVMPGRMTSSFLFLIFFILPNTECCIKESEHQWLNFCRRLGDIMCYKTIETIAFRVMKQVFYSLLIKWKCLLIVSDFTGKTEFIIIGSLSKFWNVSTSIY